MVKDRLVNDLLNRQSYFIMENFICQIITGVLRVVFPTLYIRRNKKIEYGRMVYLRTKYEILNVLYQMGAKSKLVAATQKMIKEGLLEVDIDYTDKTIYKHLRELLDLGYVKYGMNQLNAKTYYITAKGVEWVKAMEAEEVEEQEEE